MMPMIGFVSSATICVRKFPFRHARVCLSVRSLLVLFLGSVRGLLVSAEFLSEKLRLELNVASRPVLCLMARM